MEQDAHKLYAAQLFDIPVSEVSTKQRRLAKALRIWTAYYGGESVASQYSIKTDIE